MYFRYWKKWFWVCKYILRYNIRRILKWYAINLLTSYNLWFRCIIKKFISLYLKHFSWRLQRLRIILIKFSYHSISSLILFTPFDIRFLNIVEQIQILEWIIIFIIIWWAKWYECCYPCITFVCWEAANLFILFWFFNFVVVLYQNWGFVLDFQWLTYVFIRAFGIVFYILDFILRLIQFNDNWKFIFIIITKVIEEINARFLIFKVNWHFRGDLSSQTLDCWESIINLYFFEFAKCLLIQLKRLFFLSVFLKSFFNDLFPTSRRIKESIIETLNWNDSWFSWLLFECITHIYNQFCKSI